MAGKTYDRNSVRRTSGLNGTAAGSRATTQTELTATRARAGTGQAVPTLHCTLAPMDRESLLLPTNVVAEVVDYRDPEPVNSTPDWFLGQIEWQNRQIPVFSYAALIDGSEPGQPGAKARILIIKSLADSARVPYLGILISDIPRLLQIQPDHLVHMGDERKSMGVFSHVTVQDQVAVIPDLERLTHLVTHAAYGALPITQVNG